MTDERVHTAPPEQLVPSDDDDPGRFSLEPANMLLHRLAWWAHTDPDRPFLIETTGRTASYGELWTEVRRWSTLLRRLGVTPGERVLSMLASSIDAHALWMAASCVGAIEVPVNPELRGSFLAHALSDPGGRLCFVRPEHTEVPPASGVDGLEVVVVPRDQSLTMVETPADISHLPAPEDPSCIIYTSGTTGPSKGVIVSWAQMAATVGRIPRSWLSEHDIAYAYHPMFHVTGRSPLPSMADQGGRVVLREKLSVGEFWADVRRFGCTTTTVNTSLLLERPESDDDGDNPLRVAFTAGNRAHARRFADRFGVHMVEAYGSTEVGFPIVLRTFPTHGRPCGWLRRGYAARVVDEHGIDVPDGTPGELWIKPPTRAVIMQGYLGRSDLTDVAIVEGWYHTGDRLIHHQDGSFEFLDRIRDTIRRLGENISSVALEAVVLNDREVADCAAVGVPNPITGQDVLLAVVGRPTIQIDPAGLYERLILELPRHMRPAYIAVLTGLPRTATNKVRKAALLSEIDVDDVWHSPIARR